jgi:glycosyltransferase involved in cell wall biosynthesis
MTTPCHARAGARVLCVSAFPALGGAELCLLDTVSELSARGFAVEILNLVDDPGTLSRELRRRGARVHVCRIGRLRDPRGAVRVARWFIRHSGRFDVALANDARAAVYTALGTAFRRTSWIWHVHDLIGAGHRIERCARRLRPAAWIANSDAVRHSLVRHGCAAGRVTMVHNGIDVDAFHPARSAERFRRELAVDDSTLLVAAVGRLVPWKGLETLIEAASRALPVAPNAAYVIVGDVVTDAANRPAALRYREALLALRDRLRLGDRVRFLGQRTDIADVMAGIDVLVHTAIDEPFGRVLIEAMAAGKAVVATRGGGVAEIVEDGVTGYVVPPRDADAVARAVASLANPAHRSAMGRGGRARALARFSVAAYGDALARAVTAVLDGSERRQP